MKKIIYFFCLVLIILLIITCVPRFFQKGKSDKPAPTAQTSSVSGKWLDYHNKKYGYSFSYPAEMKYVNSTEEGVGGWFRNDEPGQGFNVTATATSSDLVTFIHIQENRPGDRQANAKWIVERSYEVSGFPAVIVHEENSVDAKPLIDDYSSRSVIIKKDGRIFQFDATGDGNDIFNTARFADSIRFDK